jgi:hypothetical protein
LLDPITVSPEIPADFEWGQKAVKNALIRKDTWDSKYVHSFSDTSKITEFQNNYREQAYVEFTSSPYFRRWDLDMLKIYVDSAIYETIVITPTGIPKRIAKSKISGFQEALVFFGGVVPKEYFVSISNLDESVRLHFIMPGAKGGPEFGPPGSQRESVWLRPKNSSNTIIKKAGHLVRNFLMFDGR